MKQKNFFAHMMRRCSFAWTKKNQQRHLCNADHHSVNGVKPLRHILPPPIYSPTEAQSIQKITLKADRRLMLGTSVAWQEIVSAPCFETAFLQRDFIADTSEWHHWRTCAQCIRETNFDLSVGCSRMKASSDECTKQL